MVSRVGIQKGALGDYGELIAAAAFLADRAEIAFPYGNQYKWDFLVREQDGCGWKSVQVKTVPKLSDGRGPKTLSVFHHGRQRLPYRLTDVDLIVAIHPETGTIWRIPAAVFDGRGNIALLDEYLWRGNVHREALPASSECGEIRVQRQMAAVYDKFRSARATIRDGLPSERPGWLSVETWGMVGHWADGQGYKTISRKFDVTHARVRERIFRALNRLGLMAEIPASMRNKYTRRSAVLRKPASAEQASLF